MQGLGLREFTETGWADNSHGRVHVGRGEHKITDTETPIHIPRTLWSKIFGTGKPRTTASQVRKLWSPWTSPGALRKLASTPSHDDPHSGAGSAHDGIKEAVDASVRGLEAEEGGQLDVSDALLSDSDWNDGIFEDEVAGLHTTGRNLLGKDTKTVRGTSAGGARRERAARTTTHPSRSPTAPLCPVANPPSSLSPIP